MTSDPAATPQPATPTTLPSGVTTTNTKWLVKIALICAMFAGLGIWGLIDALIVYPNRGVRAADFFEFQHLTDQRTQGPLSNPTAAIADPAATFARLDAKHKEGATLNPSEKAQHDWLEQLRFVGRLTPDATAYPRALPDGTSQDAEQRLDALKQQFTTAAGGAVKAPSPLSAFDIPSQWAICAVGFAIAGWLFATILRVKATTYRWDASERRLTLPSGASIVPSDVIEFDKSEWDKIFIKLKIRDGHPQLPGKTLKLDLLRHVPLEAWVLDMEQAATRPPAA